METSWHSYPSVFALGHRCLKDLLLDEVICEEKIDGSQFSFGLFSDGLKVRSKNKEMVVDAPEKMFQKAVDVVRELPLIEGWTYRAEYLSKPKHGALTYSRVPEKNLIIFDINDAQESYLSYEAKAKESERLGLEVVPLLHTGMVEDAVMIADMLNRESCLGGPKIEGVVIKNYNRFGLDKKCLMGKYVSEAFKETASREWRASNPGAKDIIQRLIQTYATKARWQKALQHLIETGQIEGSPRDIGVLIKGVWPDIVKECEGEIKDKLFEWAADSIRRGVTRGLPEWYKQKLLDSQFEQDNETKDRSQEN